jgi:glycerate dehydrogenase
MVTTSVPDSVPVIVVLDGHTLNPGDNPWDDLAGLGELRVHDRTPMELREPRSRDAVILLTNKTPIDSKLIGSLDRLRFIAVLATGYNVVDVAAARARGISVSNVPSYGTDTVAQHTWALILELCHRVGRHSDRVRDGAWSQSPDFSFWDFPLVELRGLTLGLVGYGRISRRVAEIALAFGMKVQFHSRHAAEIAGDFVSQDELFATSDIVSLHCALTRETKSLIKATTLSRMKRSAFLINTSRGALVDEIALYQALNAKLIAGAALDVLGEEPPAAGHLLSACPNCIITPHMAWSALAARRRLMQVTVANVRGFISGMPVNVVNASA